MLFEVTYTNCTVLFVFKHLFYRFFSSITQHFFCFVLIENWLLYRKQEKKMNKFSTIVSDYFTDSVVNLRFGKMQFKNLHFIPLLQYLFLVFFWICFTVLFGYIALFNIDTGSVLYVQHSQIDISVRTFQFYLHIKCFYLKKKNCFRIMLSIKKKKKKNSFFAS